MQERRTVEVYLDLGGQGLVAASATTLSVVGVIDNYSNRVDYDITGKFATLELEIYTLGSFQYPTPTATLDSTLQFGFGNTDYIFASSLTIQNENSIQFSTGTDRVEFSIVDQYGNTNGMTVPTVTYPTLSASYQSYLDFYLGNTQTILASKLTYQCEGTLSLANGVTDRADFYLVDQYGYSGTVTPTQYYSAANIQGASDSTPTIEIGYLPIMGGALINNPAETQGIYQSYGATTRSTEFTITALNSQGSTFAITPTATLAARQEILTSMAELTISQGAVNDGTSIFGTYSVPQVFTYPDGSPIPSQKQVWTI